MRVAQIGTKAAGPTGLGSQRFLRILQNPWGSAGRFCKTLHIVKSFLKKGSAEPQKFCRSLGFKPSFSGPANSSPTNFNPRLVLHSRLNHTLKIGIAVCPVQTQIFAKNRRSSQIHPFSWKFKHLEGAENRRFSQKSEDFSQKTARNRRLGSVTLGPSP